MRSRFGQGSVFVAVVAIALGGCGQSTSTNAPTATPAARSAPPAATATPVPDGAAWRFPIERFASLGEQPVTDELAAKLQAALDLSANGHGMTASLITPFGMWSGATGMATAERRMVPTDQMTIASITKTIVAAQVMDRVGRDLLRLDAPAADRLPPDLVFDTNRATIEDLLSMRSGIPDYFADDVALTELLTSDRSHRWTLAEKLATIGPERGAVGPDRPWEYIGTNYLLLGLILERTSRDSLGGFLREHVLRGARFDRLIYQPDERPTAPFALPDAAPEAAFESGGGYLPSIANVTMFTSEGAMASDAPTLARWFRDLCAGEVVPPGTLDDMTDFARRPEYGLGIFDRRYEYGARSGALGHTGYVREGGRTAALCFQDPGLVVVVLSNFEHDVDTTAGDLVNVLYPGAAQ